MDEEKIVDKILKNYSIARAYYELGYLDRLKAYLKCRYSPEIEIMLGKGMEKNIILNYLKNKRTLLNILNNVDLQFKSIRFKVKILSYIYLTTLSILIPIILILNIMIPRFISGNSVDTNVLFLLLIIYGAGQIIMGDIIFNHISLNRTKATTIIFKVALFLIIVILLQSLYNNFLIMLSFK